MDAQTSHASYLANLDVRVVVFSLCSEQLQVLLAPACGGNYAGAPWQLPGQPVPSDKSLEDAATETVLELAGLREAFLEQLYTYGETQRHPGQRLVSVVYFAIVPAGAVQARGAQSLYLKDDCQAKWFPVNQLPALEMDYGEVIQYALRRLRYKLEYTAIGFQLLPEFFSLSELQSTYETILGEKIDKRNFRRRILQAGVIEETSHVRGGEGRPARLFRYRPDAVAEVKARRLFP